jgi:hypothetical protein
MTLGVDASVAFKWFAQEEGPIERWSCSRAPSRSSRPTSS